MGQFFDELVQESRVTPGRPLCSIAKIEAKMDAPDILDLEKALAEPSIFGSVIARKLTSVYGVPVKGQTVQRHRNGECSCG